MELLFRNKRGTAKLCIATNVDNIWKMNSKEVDILNETLALNEGYTWEPVKDGFAHSNNLPLVKA